jgi:hypothetical protein
LCAYIHRGECARVVSVYDKLCNRQKKTMDTDFQISETFDIHIHFSVNMDIYILFDFEDYSLSDSMFVSNKIVKYLILSLSAKYKLFENI